MKASRFAAIAVTAVALAGCTTVPQRQAVAPGACKPLGGGGNSNAQNAAIGAVAGAVLGGVVGGSVANKSSVGVRNGLLLEEPCPARWSARSTTR